MPGDSPRFDLYDGQSDSPSLRQKTLELAFTFVSGEEAEAQPVPADSSAEFPEYVVLSMELDAGSEGARNSAVPIETAGRPTI